MTTKTATKEYPTIWAGVGSIDGILRTKVKSADITELMAVFTDPTETQTIEIRKGEVSTQTYTGYTVFRGIAIETDGTVISMGVAT